MEQEDEAKNNNTGTGWNLGNLPVSNLESRNLESTQSYATQEQPMSDPPRRLPFPHGIY